MKKLDIIGAIAFSSPTIEKLKIRVGSQKYFN